MEAFKTELAHQKTREAVRLADLQSTTGASRHGLLRAGVTAGGVVGLDAAVLRAQFFGMVQLVAALLGGGAASYAVLVRWRRPVLEPDAGPPNPACMPKGPFPLRLAAARNWNEL